jgi:hypothetical protein
MVTWQDKVFDTIDDTNLTLITNKLILLHSMQQRNNTHGLNQVSENNN